MCKFRALFYYHSSERCQALLLIHSASFTFNCVMYNCSNCSKLKLFYQKIRTHDLRNQQREIFSFCYIAIISDKNTYHYNSKVLCRVTRVSNSLDKFVWLIGWLGIEKSGQIINHCHNAYQYHDEIRRISLKYMILSSIIKYQTIFEWFDFHNMFKRIATHL